jgi:hypothetical protein
VGWREACKGKSKAEKAPFGAPAVANCRFANGPNNHCHRPAPMNVVLPNPWRIKKPDIRQSMNSLAEHHLP